MNSQDHLQQVTNAADALDVDVFYLSGPVDRESADALRRLVPESPRPRCTLVLTTYGGDADAAYIIARDLRNAYPAGVTVCVFGLCKSAGTLLALGATAGIVMGPRGELGPLDVQVSEKDELGRYGSGLEIFASLNVLTSYSFMMFQYFLHATVDANRGQISTTTAAETATKLTLGLMSPISSQIDPLRLGRRQRALDIAERYAIRLDVPEKLAVWLAKGYPDHGFVIDLPEAQGLLGKDRARPPTRAESMLEALLSPGPELYYPPTGSPTIRRLSPPPDAEHSQTQQGDPQHDESRERELPEADGQDHDDVHGQDQADPAH